MKNEILWKWELLCDEFDEAKQNYINVFSPVIKSVADEKTANLNLGQLKEAEAAWNNWVAIQDQLKKFVEENT